MGRVIHRKCSRQGCEQVRASVGDLCIEHRSSEPPRSYTFYDGGATRQCPGCDEDKPLDAFPRDKQGRPKSTCKPCRNETNRRYKARHRDEILARRRAKYQPIRNAVYRQRREGWERS